MRTGRAKKVTILRGMRSKFDLDRPKSVDRFYANPKYMWTNPQKPDEYGVLSPVPVDNHVDSVDFRRVRALYNRG